METTAVQQAERGSKRKRNFIILLIILLLAAGGGVRGICCTPATMKRPTMLMSMATR